MLFSAQEYMPKGHLGLVCALAAEIKPVQTEQPPSALRGQTGCGIVFTKGTAEEAAEKVSVWMEWFPQWLLKPHLFVRDYGRAKQAAEKVGSGRNACPRGF
jgi:hypothetical protein